MSQLSWNEIQNRAVTFAAHWAGETYERGESQTFWSEFLDVYGIDRRRHGAYFEYATTKLGGKRGFIDLFWPGKLIVEQKSAGRDLTKATGQAYDYLPAMPDHDLPHAIVACDFATFEIHYLESRETRTFTLDQFPNHVRAFGFLLDDTTKHLAEQNPVNREAAEKMAKLHNELEANRYTGHDLELFLVRVVFCLFADDALIFEKGSFHRYLQQRTSNDGSDFGPRLIRIFDVLNTPEDERQTTLDADLQALPYVNGGLFESPMRTPDFTSTMRLELILSAQLDWSQVSPAIFGSMFQGVMNAEQRRNLGAHYTSEQNILRVIKPLFLDGLYDEFERVRHRPSELRKFHDKLSTLHFLDPACGCGNFLVITYRELRRLEHRVVQELFKGQRALDITQMLKVNVDQMHGIEIEAFPAMVAQTALWLTDHQMNREASQMLGEHYVRLPLTASANIVHANALTTDWATVIAPEKVSYILGNPPFVGHQWRSPEQVADMHRIWGRSGSYNRLDFATCWFKKAADYTRGNANIQCALVATNSISQGEQVRPLWETLSADGVQINFAHRTFQWSNDARGVAAVHCVIVGFGRMPMRQKRIFAYPDIKGDPVEVTVKRINGYLVDAPMVFITSRDRPPEQMPPLVKGSQPTDGGHLILTAEEGERLLRDEPHASRFIRPYMGGAEFLNAKERYCLWLKDASPQELRSMPLVLKRLERVREARLQSPTASVREMASQPALFTQDRQPNNDYLVIPEVSSERREYIPIGYLQPQVIASSKLQIIRQPNLNLFGLLSSRMHNAWMKQVAGRLKSDYSYSPAVYNNFPWPADVTDTQHAEIERLAQAVLDARAQFPDSTLADLYDPNTMPPALTTAHRHLDRAVDLLYRKQPFDSDVERVEMLFDRYRLLTTPTP